MVCLSPHVLFMIDRTFYNRLRVFEHAHPLSPINSYGDIFKTSPEIWLPEIQAQLTQLGFTCQSFAHKAGGIPTLCYSERGSRSNYTLLLYNSYPASGASLWDTLPIFARLRALEIVHLLMEEFPIDIKWLIQLAPDPGATILSSFLDTHTTRLQADACLWDDSFGTYEAGWGYDEVPLLILGSKGRLGVELCVQSNPHARHSMHGATAPNAAWRLIWALHSIKDEYENILIDGFYDQIEGPDEEALNDTITLPNSAPILQQRWDIPEMYLGLQGLQLHYTQMLVPTCSITRIEGANQSAQEGEQTPGEARAYLDFHLVPRQTPEAIFALLRQYLDTKGFQDVAAHMLYGYIPTMPQVENNELVHIVREVTQLAYATPPRVLPTTLSSQPLALLRQHLHLPIVITTLVGKHLTIDHDMAAMDRAFAATVRQTALFIASAAHNKA